MEQWISLKEIENNLHSTIFKLLLLYRLYIFHYKKYLHSTIFKLLLIVRSQTFYTIIIYILLYLNYYQTKEVFPEHEFLFTFYYI